MRWTLLVVLVTACYRPSLEASCTVRCEGTCPGDQTCVAGVCRSPGDDCAGVTDGGVDDGVQPDGAPTCYGSNVPPFTQICLDAEPVPSLRISGSLSTDVDATCDFLHPQAPGGPVFCVKHAEQLDIATTTIDGTRPLLLLGTEQVTVLPAAMVDVASHVMDPESPPGPVVCVSDAGTNSSERGAGGGGGGSFQYFGGLGGSGGENVTAGGSAKPAIADPVVVHAGCDGGSGGGSPGGGGRGGKGGGAVYLMSGGEIMIAGTINASGASGTGGMVTSSAVGAGGGGGGAGGMIVLDGTRVLLSVDARIYALGGGGGGGSTQVASGDHGSDATGPDQPGIGGAAGSMTGRGGDATPTVGDMGQNGVGPTDGGGGGGGAAGHIWIRPLIPATSSIAPTSR